MLAGKLIPLVGGVVAVVTVLLAFAIVRRRRRARVRIVPHGATLLVPNLDHPVPRRRLARGSEAFAASSAPSAPAASSRRASLRATHARR